MILLYFIWCAASGALTGKLTPHQYFWPVTLMVASVNGFLCYFLQRAGVI